MAVVPSPLTNLEVPGTKFEGNDLYNVRKAVATLLDQKNLRFPGAQPVSFARKHLEELTREE
jgi:mRNA guanylyltransferase